MKVTKIDMALTAIFFLLLIASGLFFFFGHWQQGLACLIFAGLIYLLIKFGG